MDANAKPAQLFDDELLVVFPQVTRIDVVLPASDKFKKPDP